MGQEGHMKGAETAAWRPDDYIPQFLMPGCQVSYPGSGTGTNYQAPGITYLDLTPTEH